MRSVGDWLDASRLHFVGKLPYPVFASLLGISRAHVYLTYPFVLSWSMLEAMALGAPVIASSTPPVKEVIQHERNGLLFDFFDRDALVNMVCRVLDDANLRHALAERARQDVVSQYDLRSICLPAQVRLIETLAEGRRGQLRKAAEASATQQWASVLPGAHRPAHPIDEARRWAISFV